MHGMISPVTSTHLATNHEWIRPVPQLEHIEAIEKRLWGAADTLRAGENTIVIRFEAGDASLNRRDDLLYSLFVPARAREAFPCFDQPTLKARWSLTLDLPAAWTAVSNSARLP